MATLRTFPIRVGNIMSADGSLQIGYSGPVHPDQVETSWEVLGLPEERTTVTKRVRRVFTFSPEQYYRMLAHCLPDYVFLNFCNYLRSKTKIEALVDDMMRMENQLGIRPFKFYGYGPKSADVSEYIR